MDYCVYVGIYMYVYIYCTLMSINSTVSMCHCLFGEYLPRGKMDAK